MNHDSQNKKFKRLLLTGAAGGLGTLLRERVKPWTETLRVSDIANLGTASENEEVVICDLADKAAVALLVDDVDAVLHFGGISLEEKFEPIMQANILGLYNLYEAVHKSGIKRVIYASSNHVNGYYKTSEKVNAEMPLRPDGLYGVSKCFGEALSRYYFDRFGIETVCLRIGSCFPEPVNSRMMVTYLSYDDLVELIRCALFTPKVGHLIVFGVSNNAKSWVDNPNAAKLGFQANDSSSRFSHLFPFPDENPDPEDLAAYYQGGQFILSGPKY